MTRIILKGCNGRMGNVIEELLEGNRNMEIVAGIDLFDNGKKKYPVFTDFCECTVDADCVIDFSSPKDLNKYLNSAVSKKLSIVLCSTGFSDDDLKLINEASKKIAILRSANMSVGINTVIKMLKDISAVLAGSGFDIEIVEKHHRNKLDAPSGTALQLADAVNSSLDAKKDYVFDRSERREKRPDTEIGISAVRGGSIVGEHEVIFAGTDEVIEIKHTAYSRAIFGKGAITAAAFLAGKSAGMYSMQDVIG